MHEYFFLQCAGLVGIELLLQAFRHLDFVQKSNGWSKEK